MIEKERFFFFLCVCVCSTLSKVKQLSCFALSKRRSCTTRFHSHGQYSIIAQYLSIPVHRLTLVSVTNCFLHFHLREALEILTLRGSRLQYFLALKMTPILSPRRIRRSKPGTFSHFLFTRFLFVNLWRSSNSMHPFSTFLEIFSSMAFFRLQLLIYLVFSKL